MKPYNELTSIGKKRRLTKLVRLALAKYDIDLKSLKYYLEETNIFYRLSDINGKKYTLKIFREESTTLEDNLAEVFFLDEVKKNSDIVVPTVIKSKDGESIVVITSEYFDTPKRIALYEWVEGRLFADCTTMERFYSLGKATAKLHIATENTNIPSNLNIKKWDKVFYFADEEIVYKNEKYQDFLDDNFYNAMDFIVPYLNKCLAKHYVNTKIQLLHGDLNPWNVLVHKEEIRFIDFEDNILGIPLHDIAIMLFYYRHSKNYDYYEVRNHFLKGYRSIKELPQFTDYDMDVLIIARLVNFLNYVLVIEEDEEEYCKKWIKSVEEFIKRYANDEYITFLGSK